MIESFYNVGDKAVSLFINVIICVIWHLLNRKTARFIGEEILFYFNYFFPSAAAEGSKEPSGASGLNIYGSRQIRRSLVVFDERNIEDGIFSSTF